MTTQIRKITDIIKLRNSKCKRSKNLIKKCMELSQLCDLKINLVIFDKTKNKLTEFASIDDFKVEQILKMKLTPQKKKGGLKIKYISNNDMGSYMKAGEDINEQEDEYCMQQLKNKQSINVLPKAADLQIQYSKQIDQICFANEDQADYKKKKIQELSDMCAIDTIHDKDFFNIENMQNMEKMFESINQTKRQDIIFNQYEDNSDESESQLKDPFFKRTQNFKRQKKADDENKFVNYKKTESQVAMNESQADNDVFNFLPFPNILIKKEKPSDDSVINQKSPIAPTNLIISLENTSSKKDFKYQDDTDMKTFCNNLIQIQL